jgi:hypothetical protein
MTALASKLVTSSTQLANVGLGVGCTVRVTTNVGLEVGWVGIIGVAVPVGLGLEIGLGTGVADGSCAAAATAGPV